MWLRERQCRVLCYSLSSKIFANPESFYDDVVLIDVVSDMAPLAEEIQPESTTTSAVPPTKKLRTLVTSEPAREPTVKMLLETLPELRTGQSLHLSVAARRLREAGLLSKTAASTSLFKRYPAQFQLTPSQKPNNVRYRG